MNLVNYENIVKYLEQEIPEFKKYYLEELDYLGGEPLAHPIFGTLTHFFIEKVKLARKNDQEALDLVKRIAKFVEINADSDDEKVVNLIYVSFLENLDNAKKKDYEYIKTILGPKSLKGLKIMRDYWGQKY